MHHAPLGYRGQALPPCRTCRVPTACSCRTPPCTRRLCPISARTKRQPDRDRQNDRPIDRQDSTAQQQHDTAQHSTAATQHSTAQHSTAQHSTATATAQHSNSTAAAQVGHKGVFDDRWRRYVVWCRAGQARIVRRVIANAGGDAGPRPTEEQTSKEKQTHRTKITLRHQDSKHERSHLPTNISTVDQHTNAKHKKKG